MPGADVPIDLARQLTGEPPAAAGAVQVEQQVVLIRPVSGWQPVNVRELWLFRELLYFLIWRDVKVRYKQTLLGAAWAVLQPAMMMVVFSIFFGRMAGVSSGNLPYPVFVYLGLLPWTFFSSAVSSAGNSVVGSERLITKIYFPRLVIPFASVGAAVVDLAIAFGLLVVMMLWYGVRPGPSALLLPLIVIVIGLASLGVGSALAALNVSYRDFRYVIPFLVQLWMFATPTIYMQTARGGAHGHLSALLVLNPMTGLVAAFRAASCGAPLDWGQLGACAAFAVAAFLGGCVFFRRAEQKFADVI